MLESRFGTSAYRVVDSDAGLLLRRREIRGWWKSKRFVNRGSHGGPHSEPEQSARQWRFGTAPDISTSGLAEIVRRIGAEGTIYCRVQRSARGECGAGARGLPTLVSHAYWFSASTRRGSPVQCCRRIVARRFKCGGAASRPGHRTGVVAFQAHDVAFEAFRFPAQGARLDAVPMS